MSSLLKYDYTFKNHFCFGYLPDSYFESRTSPHQIFTFKYGAAQKPVTSWRESNRLAAQAIAEKLPGPFWILFSGGTDSECCIRSFLDAGIPFRLASLRFKSGQNSHDLQHVERISKQLGLAVDYFDLDVESFIQSSELLKYTDPIQSVSPILACHLWLADQVRGTPIIAQGEVYLRKVVASDYEPGVSPYSAGPWNLVESERLCSLYMHFIRQNKPAVPGFFQYLPEQIHSFLTQNPILHKLVNNQVIGKLGTRTSKNAMVRQFYPEIEERQKWTGFEHIYEIHDKVRNYLGQRYSASNQDSEISYEQAVAMVSVPGFTGQPRHE